MQALTLAKQEAQGALLSLVLSSDANAVAFSDGQGPAPSKCDQYTREDQKMGAKRARKRALWVLDGSENIDVTLLEAAEGVSCV